MSISFTPEGLRNLDLDHPLHLNVGNSRGAELLRYLGIDFAPEDMVGAIEPDDLLSRIDAADPIDTGAPAYEWPRAEGQARVIEGGIRPGYFAEKLGELKGIAEYAREHHLRVVWS